MSKTRITFAVLGLGAALAFAGQAQAEQTRSPLETAGAKQRVAVAGFVRTANAGQKTYLPAEGYTRQLWKNEIYAGSQRSK